MVQANVKLEKKDYFRFLLYYMYARPSAFLYLAVGCICIGGGIYFVCHGNSTGAALIIVSLLYFLAQPLVLYLKSVTTLQDERLKRTTRYLFSEGSILISQDEGDLGPATLFWTDVEKMVSFAGEYFIYIDKNHANIIPAQSFEGSEKDMEEIARKHLPDKKRRGF